MPNARVLEPTCTVARYCTFLVHLLAAGVDVDRVVCCCWHEVRENAKYAFLVNTISQKVDAHDHLWMTGFQKVNIEQHLLYALQCIPIRYLYDKSMSMALVWSRIWRSKSICRRDTVSTSARHRQHSYIHCLSPHEWNIKSKYTRV